MSSHSEFETNDALAIVSGDSQLLSISVVKRNMSIVQGVCERHPSKKGIIANFIRDTIRMAHNIPSDLFRDVCGVVQAIANPDISAVTAADQDQWTNWIADVEDFFASCGQMEVRHPLPSSSHGPVVEISRHRAKKRKRACGQASVPGKSGNESHDASLASSSGADEVDFEEDDDDNHPTSSEPNALVSEAGKKRKTHATRDHPRDNEKFNNSHIEGSVLRHESLCVDQDSSVPMSEDNSGCRQSSATQSTSASLGHNDDVSMDIGDDRQAQGNPELSISPSRDCDSTASHMTSLIAVQYGEAGSRDNNDEELPAPNRYGQARGLLDSAGHSHIPDFRKYDPGDNTVADAGEGAQILCANVQHVQTGNATPSANEERHDVSKSTHPVTDNAVQVLPPQSFTPALPSTPLGVRQADKAPWRFPDGFPDRLVQRLLTVTLTRVKNKQHEPFVYTEAKAEQLVYWTLFKAIGLVTQRVQALEEQNKDYEDMQTIKASSIDAAYSNVQIKGFMETLVSLCSQEPGRPSAYKSLEYGIATYRLWRDRQALTSMDLTTLNPRDRANYNHHLELGRSVLRGSAAEDTATTWERGLLVAHGLHKSDLAKQVLRNVRLVAAFCEVWGVGSLLFLPLNLGGFGKHQFKDTPVSALGDALRILNEEDKEGKIQELAQDLEVAIVRKVMKGEPLLCPESGGGRVITLTPRSYKFIEEMSTAG